MYIYSCGGCLSLQSFGAGAEVLGIFHTTLDTTAVIREVLGLVFGIVPIFGVPDHEFLGVWVV